MKRFLKRSWYWMVLFLFTDAVFIFVTWIIRREAIKYMSLFLLLFTVFVLTLGLFAEFRRWQKDTAELLNFLETPDDQTKENLLKRFDDSETIHILCARFLSGLSLLNEKTVELSEYREYIEAWVHEAKTPLSLFALILGNHRDEISPYVYARLNYIQRRLNEDIEQILYYARLQAEHSDIKFTRFHLGDCVMEVFEEYQALIEEKGISLTLDLAQAEVVSDRKIVSFMLSQLIGNAVKYADGGEGKISLSICRTSDKIRLVLYNNGEGVPPEDAPFVFDKGFTGNHPNRQKATGMGLYLVRKYAGKLCVEVKLASQLPFESGFGIELGFPL